MKIETHFIQQKKTNIVVTTKSITNLVEEWGEEKGCQGASNNALKS